MIKDGYILTQKQQTTSDSNMMSLLGAQARECAARLVTIKTTQINAALSTLSNLLKDNHDKILAANEKDLINAKDKNLSDAKIDRLTLTPERIENIAQSVMDIAALDEPCGQVLETTQRPNGLTIDKISVPIGVLGMIYESRPNVTIDAAALCLKSHNAVILRGGSDSFHSSTALHAVVQDALIQNNLPAHSVQIIPETDRAHVGAMLMAHEYIDVMIPRGGASLTARIMTEATMPVFAHLDGNCHIYVHASADPTLARNVILNAKLRRTGICGAAESLLFDRDLPENTAKEILTALLDQDCTIVGDTEICALDNRITPATEEDWAREYLTNKISCKTVNHVDDAITHINSYGSHHTDSILCEDENATNAFLKRVDSAIVMHNTSTQFADGGEFGMGAEIGIATGKLHARGPVGVKQLTTFKYLVRGTGQTRP